MYAKRWTGATVKTRDLGSVQLWVYSSLSTQIIGFDNFFLNPSKIILRQILRDILSLPDSRTSNWVANRQCHWYNFVWSDISKEKK